MQHKKQHPNTSFPAVVVAKLACQKRASTATNVPAADVVIRLPRSSLEAKP